MYKATSLATFLFADNTSCLAEHDNLNELITFVNTELKKLANWFRSNKMAVNIAKTKYIIFRTKGKKIPTNTPPVVFDNNEIGLPVNVNEIHPLERVYLDNPSNDHKTYKLLGVFLDEYLNFDYHVQYIRAKLSRSLFCIKRVANTISLKALKSLYYALIHPHLLYCINITSCTSKSNLTSLARIQKKAISTITKSNISSHTGPLFINLGILPYDKLITQAKLCFMHSIFYKYCPPSFESTFPTNETRDIDYPLRNNDDFIIPRARIEFIKRFPLHSFPTTWNNFGDIKLQHNKITFQIALKRFLFESIIIDQ